MAEGNPIRREDLGEKNVAGNLIEGLTEVIKLMKEADNGLTSFVSDFKTASSLKMDSKGIQDFNTAVDTVNATYKKKLQLEKDQAKTIEAYDKLADQVAKRDQKRAEQEARNHKKREEQYNKEIKKAQELERPYVALRTELARLENQYRDLVVSGRESEVETKNLKEEIDKLRATSDMANQSINRFGDNVGNYENAIKPLKTQLRELTVILQNMDEADPRFNNLVAEAGQLRDKISDTKAVIEATAGSGVENLSKGIANVGKVGINAFQGIEGALALVGVENEDVLRSLQKLQALSAIADSLQGLGALSDTMTEIKASFTAAATQLGIFTTAKEADIVVTETQAAVTEGAEVATSKLGKSMKALPIIAIIAGIGALVYMIYNYVKSNDEASKAIAKRKEQERLVNEEIKKSSEFIAKESSAFIGLISQLGQTNKNSKERSDLIKDINSQYGTTLKNIQDETQFQAQLNLAVEDYIKFKEAQYRLQKNEKAFEYNLGQQIKLEKQLKSAQEDRDERLKELGQRPLFGATEAELRIYDDRLKQIQNSQQENIFGLEQEIIKYKEYNVSLATVNLSLNSQTQGRYENTEATKKNTESTKDHKKAIDELNESIALSLTYQKDEIELLKIKRTEIDADEIARADEMINARKKTIAEINVLDAELAGSESEIDKARIEQIKTNLEVELDNIELSENEKERLRKQADLEIQKIEDKQLERSKEVNSTIVKGINDAMKLATDLFTKNIDKQIAKQDEQIEKSKELEQRLRDQANNGNINAQESILAEQRLQEEAIRKKEQLEKRKARITAISGILQSYSNKVANGDKNPVASTLLESAELLAFLQTLPSFKDGTIDTGNGGKLDKDGGHLAVLHPNERVVDKSNNKKMGGISNDQLADIAYRFQTGQMVDARHFEGATSQPLNFEPVERAIERMQNAITNEIRNQPRDIVEWDQVVNGVERLTKTTIEKQVKTITQKIYRS